MGGTMTPVSLEVEVPSPTSAIGFERRPSNTPREHSLLAGPADNLEGESSSVTDLAVVRSTEKSYVTSAVRMLLNYNRRLRNGSRNPSILAVHVLR